MLVVASRENSDRLSDVVESPKLCTRAHALGDIDSMKAAVRTAQKAALVEVAVAEYLTAIVDVMKAFSAATGGRRGGVWQRW